MSWRGLIASNTFNLAIMQQLLIETSDLRGTGREWGSLSSERVSSHQICFFILYLLSVWAVWNTKYLQLQLMGWELSSPQLQTRQQDTCSHQDPAGSGGVMLNFTLVVWRTPNSEITERQLASIYRLQLPDREKTRRRKSHSQYIGGFVAFGFSFNRMN